MSDQTPHITSFTLGAFETNCFIVHLADHADCWIVDCGEDPGELLDAVASKKLHPTDLLLTHAHAGHIAGVKEALRRFPDIRISIHPREAGFCSDPMLNLSAMAGMPLTIPEPEGRLEHGQRLMLGSSEWEVLHTPGHSPGGITLLHRASNQAIVGDTLFAGSIGRFDFPTSNRDDLHRSIHEVLLKLPDEVRIFPGHGPQSTIGHERQTNPFILHGF